MKKTLIPLSLPIVMDLQDKPRVVLDTNVLVSAIIYGGIPQELVKQVINGKLIGITSPWLLVELMEVLAKKFEFSREYREIVEQFIRDSWVFVMPEMTITVLQDTPDNRVLEAAATGNCSYIVTGDKELLALREYKTIHIFSPADFFHRIS